MFLDFEKWHGCRNDFVVVWLGPTDDVEFESLQRQATRICTRNGSGVGADGIIVLHKASSNDLLPRKLSVINADGSLAKTCGNGIRCAALSVLQKNRKEARKMEIPEGLEFELAGHTVMCTFLSRANIKGEGSALPLVAVEMGIPDSDADFALFEQVKSEVRRHAPNLKGEIHATRIGNDHIVVLLDDKPEMTLFRDLGAKLQKSQHWDGINVHLASQASLNDKERGQIANLIGEAIDESYSVLCWERGVGETAACGSGACAVGVAVLGTGLVNRDQWLGIEMPGGRLFVKQLEGDSSVTLAGPAEFVFRGTIEI